jgi:4-hydroxy-2-oxoheptanedioate aldolase
MFQSLRSRLNNNERVVVAGIGRVFHTNFVQCLGVSGMFHGVWIDQEHCGVRIAPTSYAVVTQCLEAGAGGIMAAMVRSAAEAEQIVQWAKFAPRGMRGLNNGGVDGKFGTISAREFTETANRESLVLIQIETAQAVEEAEAIAAVDGVDMLFIGPFDLSQAMGVTGDFFHPKCLAAIERVAKACEKAGKKWAALTTTQEHCQMLLDQGCSMITPASDMRIVNAGLKAIRDAFPAIYVKH